VQNPSNATGKVDHISDQFSYGPGRKTLAVVTVARDKTGALTRSNPFAARRELDIKSGTPQSTNRPGTNPSSTGAPTPK
jgi:hypothetical protein